MLLETITHNNLPNSIQMQVDTLYEVEVAYTFTSWPMKLMAKLMPGMFKKQAQKMLERFRIVVEK